MLIPFFSSIILAGVCFPIQCPALLGLSVELFCGVMVGAVCSGARAVYLYRLDDRTLSVVSLTLRLKLKSCCNVGKQRRKLVSTSLCTDFTNIYQDCVTQLLFRCGSLNHKQHGPISNLDHHYSIKIIQNGWLLRHSYPLIINCIGNLQSFGNLVIMP